MSNSVTLRDIQIAINRLEDKVDARLDDHEKRIRENENFKNKAYGIVAVLSGAFTLLLNWIFEVLRGR